MEPVRVLIVDGDGDHAERVRVVCGDSARTAAPDSSLGATLSAFRPQLIIADCAAFLDDSDWGDSLRAYRAAHPAIAFIALIPTGHEGLALAALKAGASNYLFRPAHQEILHHLLAKYESSVRRTEREALLRDLIVEQKERIVMPTDSRIVSHVVDHILGKLEDAVPHLDSGDIRLGLEEIIRNSVEHGNLEIGFHAKSDALARYGLEHLIVERMKDPRLASRRVAIEYHLDGDTLRVCVEDEGPGFDYRNLWDPLSEEGVQRLNGRGIFLTRAFFDDVRYTGRGNRVELVKKLGRVEARETARR